MRPVEYRERIYDVFADRETDFETKVDRVLGVGVEFLDLPIGFYTRIEDGTQEFVRSTGDHPLLRPGETCPLDEAYCQRTIEVRRPLAVGDAAKSAAVSDDAVDTFELASYIGARVVVDGSAVGTVCFADTEARADSFSEAESFFVELTARLVGQALERDVHEAELRDHKTDLNTKEEAYRAVVDSSFDLIFQTDDEARFTYVSPSADDLLGRPPEAYVGSQFTNVLSDEETAEEAWEMYEAVLSGETVQRECFPLEDASGNLILADVRATPLYSGETPPGERTPADIVGAQGMVRDVRDRERRQRLIRVLNRVLRHNLRTDMNVVSGFADMLHERLTGDDAECAAKIADTSERLVTLSETARKLEQNLEAPPELRRADVVPVVNRAAEQVGGRYPGATVIVDAPESAVARTAPRLETAVWELVDNAAKHAGDDPSIRIGVAVDDSRVSIRITDDGPGLPDQDRAVLVTGEETPLVHGSGLGLWLVHWVVTSLDGRLEVHEVSDKTCVEILLVA